MKELHTIQEWENVKDSYSGFLFKHSSTCPISARAFQEFRFFVKNNLDAPAYFITVQTSRPLSNYIEEVTGIRHESPQVFYFKDGKVVESTSHTSIKENLLVSWVR
ncbi:bacillithiol system redox-active protein YtxJ [Mangrovibacillus cuniculi]|nr:bacillithiol system redox-active protein YtxJ [Mangrovibacillus cuniculi]